MTFSEELGISSKTELITHFFPLNSYMKTRSFFPSEKGTKSEEISNSVLENSNYS
jgi:hypothetical protein